MKESQYCFKVSEKEENTRIDKYLSEKINSLSRSYITKLISQNKVTVNKKKVEKNYALKKNDKVEVIDTGIDYKNNILPQPIKLDIRYEDNYLAVVSKPAGMITHPAPGKKKDTLVNALIYHYKKLSNYSSRERPGIVHRLDKDTSGLLVVAKDSKTHELMAQKFKNRNIDKVYTALVYGKFSSEAAEIKLPIGRSRIDRKKMSISIDRGKEALTIFKIEEEFKKNCTLVSVKLKTGRTHQIRVHFSYIGHSVIGDSQYGNKESKKIADEIGLKRQFLHAKKLEFVHPVTNKRVIVRDSMPDDLEKALDILRKENKC